MIHYYTCAVASTGSWIIHSCNCMPTVSVKKLTLMTYKDTLLFYHYYIHSKNRWVEITMKI